MRGEKLLPTPLCVGAIANTVQRLLRLATKRAVELEVSKATELLGKTTAEYPTAAFLTNKPRPPTITGKAAFEVLKIEDPIYGTLLSFCRSAHVTVFTALLSVFRAVHYRLTGSSGAVIGCPNAGRDRPEIKDTVGFFVNMQCIRADVDDRTTFRGLLRKVQIAVTESFVNQDIHLRMPFPSCKLGAAYRDSLSLN